MKRQLLLILLFAFLLAFRGGWQHHAGVTESQVPAASVGVIPEKDIRFLPEFTAELTAYKKGFQLPDWAKQGRTRQIRFDGGPMFAACQIESGWKYLTDPKTPGFVGMIKSIWTLPNLYTNEIERRLDEIRAAGYNWAWVSYQLGYAFEDEVRQRAQVRRLIQLAHARGIRITTYFSLTSVFTNSAYIGNPESRSWIQEHADGTPIAYAGIPIRLMACVNKPGRLDYLKKIVRLAVEDGADDIFWDSIFNRCYCGYCDRAFREYSRRVLGKEYGLPKSPAGSKKKSFGIEEDYELGGLGNSAVEALFTEFSHYTAAKAIAELDRYAKSINPKVLVSANSHRFRYVDEVADITWSEDANGRGGRVDEKGNLTTPAGIYQWCQAIAGGKKPIQVTVAPHEYWQLQPPEYYKQTIADAASFQANFVMLGGYAFAVRFDHDDPVAKRSWNGISVGLRFIETNQKLFENARPVSDVALYYSHASRIRPELSQAAGALWLDVTQNFMLAGIPTHLVTDEAAVQMQARTLLGKARMLVLVGVPCLSIEEISVLNDYANLGGKLVMTAETGSYTSFWTKRSGTPWHKGLAGARIVTQEDLASPSAVASLTQSVLNRPSLITLEGNGYQMANPTLQADRLLVHVINYDRTRNFKNLKVSLSPAGYGEEVTSALNRGSVVRWLTPDYQGGEPIEIVWKGNRADLILRELQVSGLLLISPR